MNCIPLPTPGQPITAVWARAITQAINAMAIRGGEGIVAHSSKNGTTIALANKMKNPPIESASEYAFKLSKMADKWCICLPIDCLKLGNEFLSPEDGLTEAMQTIGAETSPVDARFNSVYELATTVEGLLECVVYKSREDGEESEIWCEFQSASTEGGGGDEGDEIASFPIAYVHENGTIEQITKGAVVLPCAGISTLLVKSKSAAQEQDAPSDVDEQSAVRLTGKVVVEGQGNIEIFGEQGEDGNESNKLVISVPRIPVIAGEKGLDIEVGKDGRKQKIYVTVTSPEERKEDGRAAYVVDLSTSPDNQDSDAGCCNSHSQDKSVTKEVEEDNWSEDAWGMDEGNGDGMGGGALGSDWSGDHCPKDSEKID